MTEAKEEFDPSKTVVKTAVSAAAKRKITMWLTGFATVGAAIVALNTFTGLNFRPAWGYEIEQIAQAEARVQKRLDAVLKIQDTTSRAIGELKKGQLQLRIKQIEREKRDLNREYAEHQTRAQAFRDRSEPVPGWLLRTIADAESEIKELDHERGLVENQLLELE